MMRVFVSIADKTRLPEQARELMAIEDCEFWGTEGSARKLNENGVPARDISPLVGGPPVFNHRVASISRPFAEGCLARNIPEDLAILEEEGVPYFDFIYVNFYDLKGEIEKIGSTLASVIEKIDIGGPLMARMGAKGYPPAGAKGWRIVVCDPDDWDRVIAWLREGRPDAEEFLRALAAKAERYVAKYVDTSARYLSRGRYWSLFTELLEGLLYGENKHQVPAEFHRIDQPNDDPLAMDKFQVVSGQPRSYNNILDTDRALSTVTLTAAMFYKNFSATPFIVVGVKHGNACGMGVSWKSSKEALQKMVTGDRIALLGGVVMSNFELDGEDAETLLCYESEKKRRLDTVVAPGFTPKAIEVLGTRSKCRLVRNKALENLDENCLDTAIHFRRVRGGVLLQPSNTNILNLRDSELDQCGAATPQQLEDLIQATAICWTSTSNTVTFVLNGQLIGNGVGQKARVDCCEVAVWNATKNGHNTAGAAVASDSFLPEIDGAMIIVNAKAAIVFITSGSVRDSEVFEIFKERGVTRYSLSDKKARGFRH
ncbi:MAG: hypothetical protein M1150_01215 [Patescibacteria group bacterium]|nr:hypothetical protein [Patescibacteria group bacterium]